MNLPNATNLDRKSGIRGPKTAGEAHHSLRFRTCHMSLKPFADSERCFVEMC